MVRKGEYLERAVVIPGEPALEGLFHRGLRRPPILIAPPHPERGGGMEGPVVAELAWALTRAGHATLRFSYPGVGASAGHSDDSPAVALERAREHLQACVDPEADEAAVPVGGVGMGFGGELMVRAATATPARFESVVWVNPDPDVDLESLGLPAVELVVVLPEQMSAERRAAIEEWVQGRPRAWVRRVPGADLVFSRGLVTLGRVVRDVFQPPGQIELPPG